MERDKTKLAKRLYEELKRIRDAKDISNWHIGRILYEFERLKLHNYLFGRVLSKRAFYAEIDIPPSTADFYISLYEFYVIKHKFTLEQLKKANTKKLHRCLPLIREKSKEEIFEIIDFAEREKQSLSDFLINCGGKDTTFCQHEELFERNIRKCKNCGKVIKN